MAGSLSRSTPSPVTGVVATAWNAGIWGVGAAGGETRVAGAGRACVTARAIRRAGGGRGAVMVTSGSVSATCPQALGDIKAPGTVIAPTAAARNKERFAVASRDTTRRRSPTPRMAPIDEFRHRF